MWVGNANRELSSGNEVRLNNFGAFRVKHTGSTRSRKTAAASPSSTVIGKKQHGRLCAGFMQMVWRMRERGADWLERARDGVARGSGKTRTPFRQIASLRSRCGTSAHFCGSWQRTWTPRAWNGFIFGFFQPFSPNMCTQSTRYMASSPRALTQTGVTEDANQISNTTGWTHSI